MQFKQGDRSWTLRLLSRQESQASRRPSVSNTTWEFIPLPAMKQSLVVLLAIPFITSFSLTGGAPTSSGVSPANSTLSTHYCTTKDDWSTPNLDPNDCSIEMTRFFVDDLLKYGDTSYEFLSNGIYPRTQLPVQRVPRKYSYGELTKKLERPAV